MLILLSPAKTVDFSKPLAYPTKSTIPFVNESTYLMNHLKSLSKNEIQSVMKISNDLATLTELNIRNWEYPFKKEESQNALFAFKGEAYSGFDASSLTPNELEITQNRLLILSGLYGILHPLTPIIPYRLEMATKLSSLKEGSLYNFWGPKLTEYINQQLTDKKCNLIINLASDEYFKALNTKDINATIITPTFLDYSNGEYKTVSVYAKKARGAMARLLSSTLIKTKDDIIAFNSLGYHYDAKRSNERAPVFIR